MLATVSDAGATAFAEGFYRTLGEGADLPAALRAGRAELAAHGRPHEWAVPVLLTARATGPLAAPALTAAPTGGTAPTDTARLARVAPRSLPSSSRPRRDEPDRRPR